jgi:monoamine oxidase
MESYALRATQIFLFFFSPFFVHRAPTRKFCPHGGADCGHHTSHFDGIPPTTSSRNQTMLSSLVIDTTLSSPLDILVIGGGLSGLTVASELTRLQRSNCGADLIKWHLIESQSYLGGRIKNDSRTNRIDMGGAWIWPSQRKMHALVRDLGLQTVRQDDADDGRVRICDGAARIIDQLAAALDDGCITLSTAAIAIEKLGNVIKVTLKSTSDESNSQEHILYTKQLVWTAPPRMALPPRTIWNPSLSTSKMMAQQRSNTWMASVTKVAFIYEEKYWDAKWLMDLKQGLYFHRDGEAFDLYDSSIEQTDGDNIYAFTLFALVDWNQHDNSQDQLVAKRIMDRLILIASSKRIFVHSNTTQPSAWMSQYKTFAIQYWPQVGSISDNPLPMTVGSHPHPDPTLSRAEWRSDDGRDMIHFAGTECDLYSPGLMEGAVNSAYRVMEELNAVLIR